MKYNQITYARTKNMGNYESEKIELVAMIEEGMDAVKCIRQIKVLAAGSLKLDPTADYLVGEEEVKVEEVEAKPKKKAKVTKKKTTKKAKAKKEEVDLGGTVESEEADAEVQPESEHTFDQMKEHLVKVWKKKGKPVAQTILKNFGVEKSDEIAPDQYAAVIKECERCLK